jgi:hypothetical protein
VPHLIKSWEENYFRPALCEIGSDSQFAQTPLARELTRIGTGSVLAHGTYDVFGKLASFFAFACRPETVTPKQTYFVEIVVPFLHLAWLRTQPGLQHLTVIALTASMRMEDVERAFELGANAFLVKPSALEGLTAMIRTLNDWLRLNHFPPHNDTVTR